MSYVNNRCQGKHKVMKNPLLRTLGRRTREIKLSLKRNHPRKGLQEMRQMVEMLCRTAPGGSASTHHPPWRVDSFCIWSHVKWLPGQLNCTPHSSKLHFPPITMDQSAHQPPVIIRNFISERLPLRVTVRMKEGLPGAPGHEPPRQDWRQ